MGFEDDVARVAQDPGIRGLAVARAGSRELADDALQETHWAVARVKDPGRIQGLRAFFVTSLIREVNRQRARSTLVPVEDIDTTAEQGRGTSSIGSPPSSVEDEASRRQLAETLLTRLNRDRDQLLASVPARSPDHRRYRTAIVAAAERILILLLEGSAPSADWNATLQAEYPQWCREPGLARAAADQRLSRARRDVQALLKKILSRHELGY
jgi:DNA-directed RNA polymerase specialized sigma24 family protein